MNDKDTWKYTDRLVEMFFFFSLIRKSSLNYAQQNALLYFVVFERVQFFVKFASIRSEKLIANSAKLLLSFLSLTFIRSKREKRNFRFSIILPILAVNNGERGVWTFTLRDSEEDFINVTVWGSTEFVKKLSTTFTIGSVGEYILRINYKLCKELT